jgi:hypothetical protein
VGSVYKPIKDELPLNEREKFWEEMRAEEEARHREEAKKREEQQKQFQLERKLLEKELHEAHLSAAVRAAQKNAAEQPAPKPAPKPAQKETLVGGRAKMFDQKVAELAASTPKSSGKPKQFKFEVGISKPHPTPVNAGQFSNDEDFVPIIEDPALKPIGKVVPQQQVSC